MTSAARSSESSVGPDRRRCRPPVAKKQAGPKESSAETAGPEEEAVEVEESAEAEAEPKAEGSPAIAAPGINGAGPPVRHGGRRCRPPRRRTRHLDDPRHQAGRSRERLAEGLRSGQRGKGIVLHSSVQSGTSGPTAATFSMLIPNRNLNDALAAFSQIGEVRQRHDATNDITAPTVSATEELRDSNASIEGLLKELGNAESEEERESIEARLREERRRHASIRASLEHLHKRASMAEVSLRIVTPRGAGATPPSKGSSGGWSVGDALHDAGHILTVAAGALLIAPRGARPDRADPAADLARQPIPDPPPARARPRLSPRPECPSFSATCGRKLGSTSRVGRWSIPRRRTRRRSRRGPPPRSSSCGAAASTRSGRSRCCC